MSGAVHALIGAAIGSLIKNKPAAFATGIVSHAILDSLPHKDLEPALEALILVAALAAIGAWKGINSPEFWGALGGVAPDCENALATYGLITPEQKIFPTHINNGKYHGHESNERLSQYLLAAVAAVVVALAGNKRK